MGPHGGMAGEECAAGSEEATARWRINPKY